MRLLAKSPKIRTSGHPPDLIRHGSTLRPPEAAIEAPPAVPSDATPEQRLTHALASFQAEVSPITAADLAEVAHSARPAFRRGIGWSANLSEQQGRSRLQVTVMHVAGAELCSESWADEASDHGPMPQHNRRVQTSHGSALIQWCIAALPILLLGALAIELSHWHATRQRLAWEVQRAVQATSLSGGTTDSLKRHLQKNLPKDLQIPIRACITDNVATLLADFMDPGLSRRIGEPVIRHDHIPAQHQKAIAQGWPGGRGPRSHKTISQANQLNVVLSADYRARSPWVRQLIDPLTIKLTQQAIMQSHRRSMKDPCLRLN